MTKRELSVFNLIEHAIEEIDHNGTQDETENYTWELNDLTIAKILNDLLAAKRLLLK